MKSKVVSDSIIGHGRMKINIKDYSVDDLFESAFGNEEQAIARQLFQNAGFLVPFTLGSLLAAASIAIGNAVKIETSPNRVESAVVFVGLVGPKGSGKTDPLRFALALLEKLNSQYACEYKNDLKAFLSDQTLPKPVEKKILLKNSTTEALTMRLMQNPRGVGIAVDEMQSWFGSFDRYAHGSSDQAFWLSIFSSISIEVDRKTSESFRVDNPFCTVIGGIQPLIIPSLGGKMRDVDGFLDRILFVKPRTFSPQAMRFGGIETEIIDCWERKLKIILDLPYSKNDFRVLKIEPKAIELIQVWNKQDLISRQSDHQYWGIMAKLDRYLFRFALIFRVLKYAGGQHLDYIEVADVQSALKLVKYFSETALDVLGELYGSKVHSLPENKQSLFYNLPCAFTTEMGLIEAKKLGVPERTCKRFFSDSRFFRRVAQGKYEKKPP
ncbi:DUF3987 domain-containing protein [Arachidicoccus terrestris]|uniref:DUF3987 domain-containing protein n=1 Tax=Arachidicoccus terrestris TaxID=2875539 RepID=UPI001CC6B15F|nr:DUF3987 domain-containing protein [Arachidicoccus terrestris]UAY56660.1 DUF3987 domain-containing protein [Arachidicoccus terrestris]